MGAVVKKEPTKELRELLIDYTDLWARNWNWKLYTKELFSINAQYYYKYHQNLSLNSINPQDFIKVRNDFIYREMEEIGNFITHLQNEFSDYSIHDPWNKERFLKKIKAKNDFKISFKKFKKKIINDPDSYERSSYLINKIESFSTDEIIYCAFVIYKDFCKIYEFLAQRLDRKIPVDALIKTEQFRGNLNRTVLYHMTLVRGGMEDQIDTSAIEKESEKLGRRYNFSPTTWRRAYRTIITKEIVNEKDAIYVENALKRIHPDKPNLLDELYKITRSVYP